MTPLTRNFTVSGLVLVILSAGFSGTIGVQAAEAAEAPRPLITEFLAINDKLITDEDGDHPDWIEVHNPSAGPMSLDGWSLTDDDADPRKWTFPAVELRGGKRLVVFASGKDRAGVGFAGGAPELHTNFKLRGKGEYLALVDPDGRIADEYSPAYPPQRADVSYGVALDGRGRRYFDTPTPGEENDSAGVDGFVADTKFSVDRGFYDQPVTVEITTETPDAEIRVTLDGTEPTSSHGEIYRAPILVDRTTILRAAAFRSDLAPTGVDTHTYIFLEDVVLQDHQRTLEAGFPSRWGETSPDYGMDMDVIGPAGSDRFGGRYAATIKDDLQAVSTVSIVMDIDDLFGPDGIYTRAVNRGVDWERPASVELIYPDGRPGFEVRCGIRIHGGAFRNHLLTKKHSFRLLFKSIYGPTKLRFPWFGEGSTNRFDAITLRAGSNDGWQWEGAGSRPLYIRDSFARATLLAMGGVASHGSFVHVYLNGIYWGLYNAVERPDASFSATYYGGDKDDWDAISSGLPSSGSMDAWDRMVEMASAGLSDDADYQLIQGKNRDGSDNPSLEDYLDMENLADYMIANLYAGNTDWPRKNYWVGRNRRARETADPHGRGFKFYMWDTEWSIGIRSDLNTNQIAVTGGVAAAWPYLRENAEFRVLFGDQVHRHFLRGGALHVDPSNPEWDPEHPARNVPAARFMRLCDLIDRAVVPESARWGDQHRSPAYTRDEHWQRERDDLLMNYFPHRSAVVLAQLRSSGLYPKIGAPELDPHGGKFISSFAVLMTAPAGHIYYTVDGTDPRLTGGAISPRAVEIPAAAILDPVVPQGILLNETTVVKARAWTDGEWSALTQAAYVDTSLRVTEIMYHPPEPPPQPDGARPYESDDYEFIEIENIGEYSVDLTSVSLTGAIEFDFSLGEVSSLAPGELVLVVKKLAAFESFYTASDLLIAGEYRGNLSNAGEALRLEGPHQTTILSFAYDDAWHPTTDGGGHSLVIIDRRGDPETWDKISSWTASTFPAGSPGTHENEAPSLAGWQLVGDANQDGQLDISDVINMLRGLFGPGLLGNLPCENDAADAGGNVTVFDWNGDLVVDLSDTVSFLSALFSGGSNVDARADCVRIEGCATVCAP